MQLIGYVQHANVFVDDTLRNNIALGVPDFAIDPAALDDAIASAQLGMFVEGTHMRYWMKPVYEVKFGFNYLIF